MSEQNVSPLAVSALRMARLNEHDLEGFLNLYDPNVEIYDYPVQFLGTGRDHIRRIFAPLFAEKFIHGEIKQQTMSGDYVINEEIITYPDKVQRYLSIYEVKNGMIQNIRFIRD